MGSQIKRFILLGTFSMVFVAVFVAEAQESATTSSGRGVLLFPDGHWEYQDAKTQQIGDGSLDIEAGLVFQTGPQPIARADFFLIDTDFEKILEKVTDTDPKLNPPMNRFAVAAGVPKPGIDSRADALVRTVMTALRPHVVNQVTTDFSGKATFKAIRPGVYFLVGFTATRNYGSVVWNLRTEIKPGPQSLIVDARNAAIVR